MVKKIICFVLVGLLILGNLGCGEKKHSDKLVLALRSGMYTETIKKCLPFFEATHGVTCEIFELTEEQLYSYVLNDSVLRSGSYDLCMVDGSWVAEYVAEGVLADIGELGCTIDDDIIPATASICVQDGKTYLLPYYGNVTVLMYNSRTAKKVGYTPECIYSLDDLLDMCNKTFANGNGGFAYRGDTENNVVVDFLPILCAFGGWVVDENNKPTVNTETFKKAMNYYLQLIATEKPHSKESIIKGLEYGTVSATVGWPGWYKAGEEQEMEYTAFPGRVTDSSPTYNCNIYGIWTLGIPENSTNKELAGELLKYLMDPEAQRASVLDGGVPCRYSVLNDPELNMTNPHLSVICTALENGIYRPVIRQWPRFYTILGETMKKMIRGDIGVEEGLLMAQSELENLMEKE